MSAELTIAAGHFREAMDRLRLGIDLLCQCPDVQDLVVSAEYQHHRLDVIRRLLLVAISRTGQADVAGDGKHARSLT